VMRDVLVESAGDGEVIALSREPGVLGEVVTVDVPAERTAPPVHVRVVESEPVVANGTVRHRLRMEPIGAQS